MNATIHYEGRDVTFYDVDEKSHIGNCLLNVCWYELPNLEIIRKLQVSGNYVDAGAHWGTHALFFALFCPAKRVYAFEPKRRFYDALVRNLNENGVNNCIPLQSALVEYDGAELPIDEGELWGRLALDTFELPDVRILKIDTESTELNVLRGAKETLKSVEHVFLEVWPEATCKERNIEYPMAEINEFLAPYGLKPKGAMPWEDLFWWAKV